MSSFLYQRPIHNPLSDPYSISPPSSFNSHKPYSIFSPTTLLVLISLVVVMGVFFPWVGMQESLFSVTTRPSIAKWRDYTLAQATSFVAQNGTVIVCAVSQPYLPFLNNWLISIARQKHQDKVLVIAEDYATLYKVNEWWPGHAVLVPPAPDAQTAHKFGSQEFPSGMFPSRRAHSFPRGWRRLMLSVGLLLHWWAYRAKLKENDRVNFERCLRGALGVGVEAHNQVKSTYEFFNFTSRRPRHLLQILELGYNVMYNDVDMVWLADPFPYFEGNHDVYFTDDMTSVKPLKHSHDLPPPGKKGRTYICSCMIFLRPTSGAKLVMKKWIEELKDQPWSREKKANDQPAFNWALDKLANEVDLYLLPQAAFPTGGLYFKNKTWVRETKGMHVIIHNNYILGFEKKIKRFHDYDLWLVDDHADESPLGRI
ncbi:UDP-D-xylose:L-fucose alpha-1,3-D-xylosyltransferase MGP4-like [Malus sylvestris]|uniref:UDP-D-xylose:L-fucose alpha-1,3-D-xylosyltransferase MGP4-like n=1 Tax=Malus sylvestris TaxID=3752 RepID=UPI0021ABDE39|nr:UDP-D-xylose:L-fucose alpha-1,3-D-xylosyltransferase MGP4-like [Malus sylvestris]